MVGGDFIERAFHKLSMGAWMSECKLYRYLLWRVWDRKKPILLVCMLNPSTADGTTEDPTSRKVRGFAERLGYGGFIIVNRYSLKSTDPKKLHRRNTRVNGPLQSEAIALACKLTSPTALVAYGAFAGKLGSVAALQLQQHHKTLICLGTTKDGYPKHPLYVPYETTPVGFSHVA